MSTKTQMPEHLQQAVEKLPSEIADFVRECAETEHPESRLIEVLHHLQEEVGCLQREHLDAVAQLMGIPTAKVTGVATFYHLFTFVPRGEHRISVCLGTACFVKGAGKILERLQEMLDLTDGSLTTEDGRFSLESARCVGACALAPVVIIDDKVYGNVKPDQLPKILKEYGFEPKQKAEKGA